jgi:hypothetical protein
VELSVTEMLFDLMEPLEEILHLIVVVGALLRPFQYSLQTRHGEIEEVPLIRRLGLQQTRHTSNPVLTVS